MLEKPVASTPGQSLEIKLFHNANADYLIGRFAIDVDRRRAGQAGRDRRAAAWSRSAICRRQADARAEASSSREAFTKAEAAGQAVAAAAALRRDTADLMVMEGAG